MRQEVEAAINSKIRPYLQSLGNDVAVTSVVGGVVTLRIQGEPAGIMRVPLRAAVSMKLRELAPSVQSVNFVE
jgi:Fe-S cluster biogenesis protein NfuA